jgi:hypothetical protein
MKAVWFWIQSISPAMNIAWFWIQVVLKVLGAIVVIYQLPAAVKGIYRFTQDWWSLRSHRTTTNRLAKLELVLKNLDALPVMDQQQADFYNAVFLVLALISAGLLSAAFFTYGLLGDFAVPVKHPPFLSMAIVIFAFGAGVSMGLASYFRKFSPKQRAAKRVEIEKRIESLKHKLAATADRIAKH